MIIKRLIRSANWGERVLLLIAALGLFVALLTVLLGTILKAVINQRLDDVGGYRGHVDAVGVHLIAGKYSVSGLIFSKKNGADRAPLPVSFLKIEKTGISLSWKRLFDGKLVASAYVNHPRIDFVNSKMETKRQTGKGVDWIRQIRGMMPFRIDQVMIHDGEIHLYDYEADTGTVHVFATAIEAKISNLTNSLAISRDLFAEMEMTARAMDQAPVKMSLLLNPYTRPPTFDLNFSLKNLKAVTLNNLLRTYGGFDLQQGTLDLAIEVAVKSGTIDGYVKPLFQNIDATSLKEMKKEDMSPSQAIWESIIQTAITVLENNKNRQFGTRIPFSGRFKDPDVDVLTGVAMVLYNGFIRALLPGVDLTISLGDVGREHENNE